MESDQICRKLQVFVNKCETMNTDLLILTQQWPLPREIRRQKFAMGWALSPDNDIAKMSFEWNPQDARNRGRLSTIWLRSELAESMATEKMWLQIKRLALEWSRGSSFRLYAPKARFCFIYKYQKLTRLQLIRVKTNFRTTKYECNLFSIK